jgi:hypothetical protein
MMRKTATKSAGATVSPVAGRAPVQPAALTEEDRSKDAFFAQLADIAEAMIARHGKDFAMGTLILSARFIAEGKPLSHRPDGDGATKPA